MAKIRAILEISRVIGIVFLGALLIRLFIFQPFIVEGNSMEPGFHHGQYILVEKIQYHFSSPKRGDIIVLKYPRDPRVNYIKRIIAVPGDTLKIEQNKVWLNGAILEEPYLKEGEQTQVSNLSSTAYQITLNADEYFVMGDNRSHSSDSREWGPLKKEFIVGRMALVIYPKSPYRAVASPSY